MRHTSVACLNRYGLLESWWLVRARPPAGDDQLELVASSRLEATEAAAALALAGFHHIVLINRAHDTMEDYRLPWGARQSVQAR